MKTIDERIRRVLSISANESDWNEDLRRLERGDTTLTRKSAGDALLSDGRAGIVCCPLSCEQAGGGGEILTDNC